MTRPCAANLPQGPLRRALSCPNAPIGIQHPDAHVPTSGLYVDPTHMGGLTYLTYAVPLLLILVAIVYLYRPSVDMTWW